MTDLMFSGGKNNILRIRVIGKKMYFMNISNGSWMIQDISKVLAHMTKTKMTDDRKDEMYEKIKLMEDIVVNLTDQNEVESYVIKEMESVGFKLIKIEKPGFRPIIKENK